MQMNRLMFWSFLIVSAPAVADEDESKGSIVLEGRGMANQAPEFVTLGVKITSICYNTSQEASAANAEIANRTLAVLQNHKRTEKDKVTASGGANILQTETTQVGLEPKTICEMKWHAENYLKIHMSSLQDLSSLQDQILGAVNGAGRVDPNLATQTFAEMERPEFHLYPETAKKLREVAQGLAFDDAKAQLSALTARCSFQYLRLVKVSPSEYTYVYKVAGERLPVHSTSTPVIPDEMEVQATLQMEWAFEPSAGCQL